MNWQDAQTWEASWWGDCTNTYGEEEKQLLYARRMGLRLYHNRKSPYNIDLGGRSVVDVGGGPCSLLLKCTSRGRALVVDPLRVPEWVRARYACAGIEVQRTSGEELDERGFDEAWLYNVLQHTRDPQRVIERARQAAELVRIFEWIDTPTNEGHPHTLTQAGLDAWLGGEGRVAQIDGEAQCWGRAYYGIFPGC